MLNVLAQKHKIRKSTHTQTSVQTNRKLVVFQNTLNFLHFGRLLCHIFFFFLLLAPFSHKCNKQCTKTWNFLMAQTEFIIYLWQQSNHRKNNNKEHAIIDFFCFVLLLLFLFHSKQYQWKYKCVKEIKAYWYTLETVCA